MSNVNNFGKKELLELFMHLDKIHAGKENLFVPLSIAMFVAASACWGRVSPEGFMMFAVVSIAIYGYHMLVTRRFTAFQHKIFKEIYTLQGGKEKSQLFQIVGPDGEEDESFNRALTIQSLRTTFFIAIIVAWGILILIYRSIQDVPVVVENR
ncbi:hypothetical protein [Petrachloros mirabilis]